MSYAPNQSNDHEEEDITIGPSYLRDGRISTHTRLPYAQYDGGYGRAEPSYSYGNVSYGYSQERHLRPLAGEQYAGLNDPGRHYHGLTPDWSPWNRSEMQGSEESEPYRPSASGTYLHDTYPMNSSGTSADGEMETPSVASEEPDNGNNMAGSSKKFRCPLIDCSAAFSRKADKDRHYECVHRRGVNKKYDCTVAKCNRSGELGFTRKDHLTEHLRNYHHQLIPKRRKAHSGEAEN